MIKLERRIATVVMNMAVNAIGKDSLWGMYQPKEPSQLLKRYKKEMLVQK